MESEFTGTSFVHSLQFTQLKKKKKNYIQKILSKSQYFISAGRIVEDTLYRFIDEIISLQDIPQKDSEYISEFCEMMERLEGLFVYSSGEVSSHISLFLSYPKNKMAFR